MKAVYCFWKTNIFLRYSVHVSWEIMWLLLRDFSLGFLTPHLTTPTHTHTPDIAQEATVPHSVPCFPQSQIRVFSLWNIFSLGSPLSQGTPVRLKISASPSLTSMPVCKETSFLWLVYLSLGMSALFRASDASVELITFHFSPSLFPTALFLNVSTASLSVAFFPHSRLFPPSLVSC